MLTSRFDELWELLVEKFTAYHDAERNPTAVVSLAAARTDLDEVRAEIRRERLALKARKPRPLNRQDEGRRRETAPGVPVLLFDADIDKVKINVVQRVHPSN